MAELLACILIISPLFIAVQRDVIKTKQADRKRRRRYELEQKEKRDKQALIRRMQEYEKPKQTVYIKGVGVYQVEKGCDFNFVQGRF